MKERVVVVGARGRLGSYACELLEASDDFDVTARLGSEHDLEHEAAGHSGAIALDLTVAGAGAANARILLRAGLPTVVGTSGVTDAEVAELHELSRQLDLGVAIVPNFARGAALLAELAARAADLFAEVELTETHRVEKRDAPSGTALRLAAELRERMGAEVPIRSVRAPQAPATHELNFRGAGESLRLIHSAVGLEAYGAGILDALRRIRGLRGATHGWTELVEWDRKSRSKSG